MAKKAVDIIFSMHKLREYFKVIITREDVKRLKPDPEAVLLALKKLGALTRAGLRPLMKQERNIGSSPPEST